MDTNLFVFILSIIMVVYLVIWLSSFMLLKLLMKDLFIPDWYASVEKNNYIKVVLFPFAFLHALVKGV